MRQNNKFRTIATSEVKSWFGSLSKSQLDEAQYRKIAAYLTRLKRNWDELELEKSQASNIEIGPNDYWDFKAVFDAAKFLLDTMPAMLRHWDGLLPLPGTRGGSPAITALQDALVTALPYIEWPFGRPERKTSRKRRKPWHLPAAIAAKVVIEAMAEVGHNKPSLTRNAILVRVVWKALIRMQFPGANMISASAVAAHLTRWDKEYGLIQRE